MEERIHMTLVRENLIDFEWLDEAGLTTLKNYNTIRYDTDTNLYRMELYTHLQSSTTKSGRSCGGHSYNFCLNIC